jgi:hypothetical protein
VNNFGIFNSPGEIAKTRANALKQFTILNARLIVNVFPKLLNVVRETRFLKALKCYPSFMPAMCLVMAQFCALHTLRACPYQAKTIRQWTAKGHSSTRNRFMRPWRGLASGISLQETGAAPPAQRKSFCEDKGNSASRTRHIRQEGIFYERSFTKPSFFSASRCFQQRMFARC